MEFEHKWNVYPSQTWRTHLIKKEINNEKTNRNFSYFLNIGSSARFYNFAVLSRTNLEETKMSHSGRNPFETNNSLDEFFKKFQEERSLSDFQKILQGEYPNGRLNKDDEGAVAVMIGHEKGKVVMNFPKPVHWIGFTPEQAIEIAQTLIDHARKAGISKLVTINL